MVLNFCPIIHKYKQLPAALFGLVYNWRERAAFQQSAFSKKECLDQKIYLAKVVSS